MVITRSFGISISTFGGHLHITLYGAELDGIISTVNEGSFLITTTPNLGVSRRFDICQLYCYEISYCC